MSRELLYQRHSALVATYQRYSSDRDVLAEDGVVRWGEALELAVDGPGARLQVDLVSGSASLLTSTVSVEALPAHVPIAVRVRGAG